MMRLLLAAALTAVITAAPPKVGQQAPDFRLLDQNDHVVRLSSVRGQKVVLVFYRGYW